MPGKGISQDTRRGRAALQQAMKANPYALPYLQGLFKHPAREIHSAPDNQVLVMLGHLEVIEEIERIMNEDLTNE